ncbi:TIGR02234 family membrane protein [Wenjunlia tyrosinilytica]|uniref:Membrane protein n=1 Tax=Wenjunlia tyrosinilytica TaxID=1544741 RepID=A0A917ZER7_9ACTN|nr:TIGR02234 family membrane protein [Wenjunlia tyrosinilytica]GGO81640.1 membrane protein [Wenjunlia tyrosinilytica]
MTENPAPETGRPPARGAIAAALVLGVAGAALVLLSVGRTWAEGRQGAFALTVSGREVTAVPAALALVGLAALVAVFAVRGAGRLAVSALLALSGAGVITAAVLGAGDTEALNEAAAKATGLSNAVATGVSHTAWPWVTAVGGLLLLLAGLVALARGRDWPGMSSRYEAPGARRPAPRDADRPEDMWKALDRGEDPTAGDK